MGKGKSLHVGLNFIDPNHYSGWNGELYAAEADAHSMEQVALANGYGVKKLITEEATRDNFTRELLSAADELTEGDIFFLSFAGHGGSVPDRNGDEDDGKDETLCMYDSQIIDDELWDMYARFKKGVRVLVITDCCHSGTSVRLPVYRQKVRYRYAPHDALYETFAANREFYDQIGAKKEVSKMSADLRHFSACQDNQFAADGDYNGLYTSKILEVWNKGVFKGSYKSFHQAVLQKMPEIQSPDHNRYGEPVEGYEKQPPFTI